MRPFEQKVGVCGVKRHFLALVRKADLVVHRLVKAVRVAVVFRRHHFAYSHLYVVLVPSRNRHPFVALLHDWNLVLVISRRIVVYRVGLSGVRILLDFPEICHHAPCQIPVYRELVFFVVDGRFERHRVRLVHLALLTSDKHIVELVRRRRIFERGGLCHLVELLYRLDIPFGRFPYRLFGGAFLLFDGRAGRHSRRRALAGRGGVGKRQRQSRRAGLRHLVRRTVHRRLEIVVRLGFSLAVVVDVKPHRVHHHEKRVLAVVVLAGLEVVARASGCMAVFVRLHRACRPSPVAARLHPDILAVGLVVALVARRVFPCAPLRRESLAIDVEVRESLFAKLRYRHDVKSRLLEQVSAKKTAFNFSLKAPAPLFRLFAF